MIIDARSLDDHSLIEGDICIVGAGAAGITMALEWNNTPYRVILLESGGLDYDDRVQELLRGPVTGQQYYPLKSTRLSYFGGTTGHWGGFCATLDPIDFVKREWVPESGWPITLDDIIPFYPRAHQYLELGHYDYSVQYWQDRNPAFVPLALDPRVVSSKVWRFSPPTRYGIKYRDPVVGSKNISLYTYATVVEIRTNAPVSAVQEVVVRNYAGKTHRVKARCFVLACNAIQNARVLLASNRQAPAGLGNDRDLVGRYFMEHVELRSSELWLDRPRAMAFYLRNREARAELAISAGTQTERRILNGTASLLPLSIARKLKPVIETWSSDDPRESKRVMHQNQAEALGGKFATLLETGLHQTFELQTRIEQAPNPASRVTLDAEEDELGVPRAGLHWVLTPLEMRSIRTMHELIGREFGAAGLGRLQLLPYLREDADHTWPSFTGGGWHHMGTTRMSDDPAHGVVNRNCRLFGIENLFVAGASCFTTAGAANPTLTLVALSLRLSDHIKTVLPVLNA